MANYTFTTYWVEGAKETIHQLHDAIANAEGWTSKAFENLGINTEGKEDEYYGYHARRRLHCACQIASVPVEKNRKNHFSSSYYYICNRCNKLYIKLKFKNYGLRKTQ